MGFGSTTSTLIDNGPFTGKFDLGGLPVLFNQLTFAAGAVLAGFSVGLSFPGGSSITFDSPAGVNYGLLFNSSGAELQLGGSVSLPDLGPVNVFGIFTGAITSASLSYLAASDTLQLQGTFIASQILGSSALQATVNFSGSNYIQWQDGTPYFNGSLVITGLNSAKGGFGITEIDLSVNTKAETFSGGVAFKMPFGASVPVGNVTISGSWQDGPKVTSVGVSFTGLSIVVPTEPPMIWTSASVQVSNMFTPSTPTTFSGSLGFAFGPQIAGNYVGTLTLSGTGSSQMLTASATIQLVPSAS